MVEQIHQQLPSSNSSSAILFWLADKISWWAWFLILGATYLYIKDWSIFQAQNKSRKSRRVAQTGPSNLGSPRNQQLRSRSTQFRTSSPLQSRQSSASYNSNPRSGYASPRISSLARNSPMSRSQSQSYAAAMPSIPTRYNSNNSPLPGGSPAPPSRYNFNNSPMGSPGPSGPLSVASRRFTGSLADSARKRAMNRQREDSEEENDSDNRTDLRAGKRRRRGEDSGEEMELDPSETEEPWQDEEMDDVPVTQSQARGSKRAAIISDEEANPKRTRQSSPPESNVSDAESLSASSPPPPPPLDKKKRRATSSASSTIDHQSPRQTKSSSNKKPRSVSRSKPSGKREIEEVEESTPENSDDQRDQPRNADSEFEEEEEQEEEESESENESRIKNGKRFRSQRRKAEEDGMDGEFEDLEPVVSPPPARSLPPSRKSSRSRANSIKSASRKKQTEEVTKVAGDSWTNAEGSKFRMDADGERRKLCEVREMRKKYRMPQDSTHPDRNVLQEVIVERWLSNAEYEEAMSNGKLAWQQVTEPVEEVKYMEEEVVPVEVEQMRENGVFFTGSASTPLRSQPSFPQLRTASNSTPRLNTSRFQNSTIPASPSSYSNYGVSGWTPAKTRDEAEKVRKEKMAKRKQGIKVTGGEDPDAIALPIVEPKLKLSEFVKEDPIPIVVPVPIPVPAPITFIAPVSAPPPTFHIPTPAPAVEKPNFFAAKPPTPIIAIPIPTPPIAQPSPIAITQPAPIATPSFNFGATPKVEIPKVETPANTGFSFGGLAPVIPPPTPVQAPVQEAAPSTLFSAKPPTPFFSLPVASISTSTPLFGAPPSPALFGAPSPSAGLFGVISKSNVPSVVPTPVATPPPSRFGAATSIPAIVAPTPALFGTPSTSFGQQPIVSTPAPFSFGATPAAAPIAPVFNTAPAAPSFGANPSPFGSTPFGSVSNPPVPAVPSPFGGSTVSTFGAPAAPAPSPFGNSNSGFSFNSSTPGAPAAIPSFGFGRPTANAVPSSSAFGTPGANTGFSFGSQANPSIAAPAFGVATPSFGAGGSPFASPAAGAPNLFSFGAESTPTIGEAVRRRLRRMPAKK